MNSKVKAVIAILLSAIILIPSISYAKPHPDRSCYGFKQEMRRVWFEHYLWTRDYVKSATSSLDDKEKVLQRLLKNQEEIGNALKPYYGEAKGDAFTELLKNHILIGTKVIESAMNGNSKSLQKYNREWHQNAEDIVNFLIKVNPHWRKGELTDLFFIHLKLVNDSVVARLVRDYEFEMTTSDKTQDNLSLLADILSSGIMKQFPDKF